MMRWLIVLLLILNIGYYFWSSRYLHAIEQTIVQSNVVEQNVVEQQESAAVAGLELLSGRKAGATANASSGRIQADKQLQTPQLVADFDIASVSDEQGFCWYLGFPDAETVRPDAVDKVQARLQAVGIEGDIQSMRVALPEKHLVYLPPLASEQAALARLKQLLAEGHDAYVFKRGPLQNGISLNWFSRQLLAERALQDLQKQGLDVQLQSITEFRSERWLMLSVAQNAKIVDRLWRRIINDWPTLVRQKNYCVGIAPVGDIE